MTQIYLIGFIVIVVVSIFVTVYFQGKAKGRKEERNTNIEKEVKEIEETKRREFSRNHDSIDSVRKRMCKYTRD